jgi:PKD repeat protein
MNYSKSCLPVFILCIILLTACSKSESNIEPPVAGFTYTSALSYPVTAHFANTSTGGGVSWYWNFGDGNTSTIVNPSHSYAAPGTYLVKLVETNAMGEMDSVVSTITLPPLLSGPSGTSTRIMNPATASFVYTLDLFPYTVTYTNTSTNAVDHLWDFGDGSTSTSQATTVSHTYPMSGNYFVSLTTSNTAGSDSCSALISF